MKSIFDNISEKISTAYNDAEKGLKGDFARLKNLPAILSYLNELQGEDLLLLLDQARKIKKRKNPTFPEINGDFYATFETLNPEEKEIIKNVREFMQNEVKPIANEYWVKAKFPFEIIDKMKKLKICGMTLPKELGGQNRSNVFEGIVAQEIARVDVSTCTFFGVHNGLAMHSITYCGSEEQKKKYLPEMVKLNKIGAFALTEPEVGSAISMGMKTTCEKIGDEWVINGEKKWIGNASFADWIIVWARDKADQQVKGFIVERETEGLETEVIEDKMSLRIVQNAIIKLDNVKVSEEQRLQNANSFKDTAKVLRSTRAGVAWQAVGCSRGAYEETLKYTMDRKQFGRPICGFQMTQDLLAQMLSQVTAMQTMCFRLSQLQDDGVMSDEQAALAKVFCTTGTRTVTMLARELMGGNGILISNNVARFLADSEALYSYEGTKQINSLVVGRAITGQSAFV